MVLVEDDHVVETLSPKRPDDCLDDSIRARSPNGCHETVDTDPSGSLAEVPARDTIAIAEQMAWRVAPRRRLDDLAPHPGGRRVRGDVHVHQFAAVMRNTSTYRVLR